MLFLMYKIYGMQPRDNCDAAQRIHTFEASVIGAQQAIFRGILKGKVLDLPKVSRAPSGIIWHSLVLHLRDIQLCRTCSRCPFRRKQFSKRPNELNGLVLINFEFQRFAFLNVTLHVTKPRSYCDTKRWR